MANKNTKNLRNRIRKACRQKLASVLHEKPSLSWHSAPSFIKQNFPTAVPDKDGVISKNPVRGSCQKVYRNFGQFKSQNSSLTAHEATVKGNSFQSKNKIAGYERLSKKLTDPKIVVLSGDGNTSNSGGYSADIGTKVKISKLSPKVG